MKKSIVAVGVLAVLGGAWVGGAWYTGKMIEGQLQKSLTDAQMYLDQYAPEYNAKLKIADYQRGIFSSQVNYSFEVSDKQQSDSVSVTQKISHGPFPLDNFTLSPKLAFSRTELTKQPSLDSLFEMAGGKSPVTIDILAAYSGDSDVKIVVEPLSDKSNDAFKFSGLTINGEVSVKNDVQHMTMSSSAFKLTDSTSQIEYDAAKIEATQDKNKVYSLDGSLGKLTIVESDEDNGKEQVVLSGFTIKSQGKTGKFDMSLGQVNFGLQNIAYSIDDKSKMVIDNLAIASNAQEDEKFINQTVDTTIGQMQIDGKNLGSGSLKLKLDRFDGKALQYLNKNSNQLTYLFLGGIPPQNESEQATGAMMLNNLMAFLDANPSINIAPFTWKNDKGESQMDLSLTLMRPASLNAEDMNQILLDSVKQFSSNTKLSVPMLTEITRLQYELSDGLSAQDAQAQAAESVQQLVQMGVAQQLLSQQDENTVTNSFSYADGMIDINGQKMPAEQFINLFMMPGLQ